MAKNPYDILGVSKNVSESQLKSAYRSKSKQYHPDINKSPDAVQKFKQINWANEILSDPNKRQVFDHGGDPDTQQMGGGFGGFGDMFGDIGGMFRGFGQQRQHQQVGENIQVQVTLTLQEVNKGSKKNIRYRRKQKCHKCNGTGCKSGKHKSKCSKCQGQGQISSMRRSGNMIMNQISTCPDCNGSGKSINPSDNCNSCQGEGLQSRQVNKLVDIVSGVPNGSSMVVDGLGCESVNGLAGRLFVQVNYQKHKAFEVSQSDLTCSYYLTYAQAYLGKAVKIKTVNGDYKSFVIKQGLLSGYKHRLQGCGLLQKDQYGRQARGDLVVNINVIPPKNITPQVLKLISQMGSYADQKNKELN